MPHGSKIEVKFLECDGLALGSGQCVQGYSDFLRDVRAIPNNTSIPGLIKLNSWTDYRRDNYSIAFDIKEGCDKISVAKSLQKAIADIARVTDHLPPIYIFFTLV